MPNDPDMLVDLTTARTEFEAGIIVEALRAQGVECQAFTTAGAMLQWDVAASQPMRIQVRRRNLETAAATLRAIRAESVDIDWDEVDVGDAKTLAAAERSVMDAPAICPRCKCDLSALTLPRACPRCGLDLTRAGVNGEQSFRSRRVIVIACMVAAALLIVVLMEVVRALVGWNRW